MRYLANKMVRLLYPYGGIRTVLRGPNQGLQFVVRPAMGLTYAIGKDGKHMQFFVPRVSQGSCVCDIGANRGQMMLLFAKLVGKQGHVVSFEPVPGVFRDLLCNKELNSLEHVSCIEAAVAEKMGVASFLFDENQSTQGKLRNVEQSYLLKEPCEFTVPTVSIDQLIADGQSPPN